MEEEKEKLYSMKFHLNCITKNIKNNCRAVSASQSIDKCTLGASMWIKEVVEWVITVEWKKLENQWGSLLLETQFTHTPKRPTIIDCVHDDARLTKKNKAENISQYCAPFYHLFVGRSCLTSDIAIRGKLKYVCHEISSRCPLTQRSAFVISRNFSMNW